MFYPNDDNYMQDFYFYNQMPNATYNLNNDPNVMNNYNMMPNGFNMQYNNFQMPRMQNLNNLYPSIYKIINPVVLSVIMSNNYPYLNEDNLKNMTDTVFNIVEGQLNLENENQNNINSVRNSNDKNITQTTQNDNRKFENVNSNQSSSENSEELVKDIIRILIINESKFKSKNNNYNAQPNRGFYSNYMGY